MPTRSTLGRVSTGVSMNQSVGVIAVASGELSEEASRILQKQRTETLMVALHRVGPQKESMKCFVENHRLKRA
jgi:hypothetical protein